jgi:ABC-type phosphate transport system substrate-binding protein
MKARLSAASLGLAMVGTLLLSRSALAQDGGTTINCSDSNTLPNPIVITGSTAFEPVIQAMALQLNNRSSGDAGAAAGKVSLIYQGSGSCAGVGNVKDNKSLTGTATYYTATGTAGKQTCTLDVSPKADVAISDVFYETCGLGARPTTLGDFSGPVQAMLFIVPGGTQSQAPTSITAEEAADVWGCGSRGHVSPWLIDTAIQYRAATSGTQNIIARNINVLASSFTGTPNASGGALVTNLLQLAGATVVIQDPSTAIGFLAADSYDTQRSALRALAFRGIDQTQAFFADSSSDAFDKRNVRDGHYLPWGYEHIIAAVDATGTPTDAAARKFIDWVQGNPTVDPNRPNFDTTQVESATHTIPTCAMQVQRKADGGPLSLFTPADPCGCFFESVATGATPSGCVACADDTACTGGKHCHHSFCE